MSRTKDAGWTVQETAKFLRLTDRQVRRLCQEGALEWTKAGTAYVIDPASARRQKELRKLEMSSDMTKSEATQHDGHEDVADIADMRTRKTDTLRTSRSDMSDRRPQKADMHRTSPTDIGQTSEDMQGTSKKGADIDAIGLDVQRTSNPDTPDMDEVGRDTRTSRPDMQRMSETGSDMDQLSDMLPSDITVLLHKLRASKQAVRTLHDEMSDTVDLIVRRLDYEYRRNQEVQNTLTHLLKGLRIPVDPITKRSHKWFYIVLTLFILIAAGFLALFFSGFAPCHRLVEVIRNIV